ncbi:MAG: queuosine precursor transporter [Phototrophicaceae bacterium]
MTDRTIRTIVIVSVLYVSAQIFADIASLRILLLAGFSIDGGTLIYPFTFTLRDIVHKVAGASIARTLIFLAAGVNLLMAGLFWLVSVLPPDLEVGEQSEFALVLAPVFRIVLASIVAEVISELIDTEVYSLWVKRFQERYQWGRVLISNAVSVPIDSAIFVAIAFLGDLPIEVVISIFFANVIVKGAVTIISIPGIYTVKDRHLPKAKND